MADNADKGPDTLRPAKGDDAADLYSSSTVVRDAPSELVELMKEAQAREEGKRADEAKIPKSPGVPKDLSSTKPPPRPTPKEERVEASEGPGRKLDELWDALPKAGDDDDDDDDGEAGSGSARLHAAEDVTRMLAVPDDILEGRRELSADEAKRLADAPPSIVVEDGVPSEQVSSRPKPPPKVEAEDEIIETSPRKALPGGLGQNRPLWVAYAVAAAVLLAAAIYFAR